MIKDAMWIGAPRGIGGVCPEFFEKWLCDVRAEQFENGAVPDTVPNFWSLKGSSAAWGDVICVVPWQIYMTYGDKQQAKDSNGACAVALFRLNRR